ncbi:hypothetical protein BC835DRAFT_1396021 [Cytidiella melzeri]|nr:hypothetical protein BC835DRAFT_1396021 [Cytidiella melzeri]
MTSMSFTTISPRLSTTWVQPPNYWYRCTVASPHPVLWSPHMGPACTALANMAHKPDPPDVESDTSHTTSIAQRMNLKLVFRALRRMSLWSLEFYSDVHVAGQEHVPKVGPLIVTPCHHNEIIDIATLSVTMPHRRPVCFWAKASMFSNPVAGWVLTSSGAIPVRRNPNNVASDTTGSNGPGQSDEKANEVRMSLFRGTFEALDSGEVIGLFPEGTSYTEPQIAQIKDGASWAALEYSRWQLQHSTVNKDDLYLVPVGIVYTDKARYQSRVSVRFGEPINVSSFTRRYMSASDDDRSRAVIKDVTTELQQNLLKLTINAPDWDTWFAGSIARDIAWKGSENVPTGDWVCISQKFMDLFTEQPETSKGSSTTSACKKTLVDYCGLLHHTSISHDALVNVYPSSRLPSALTASITLVGHLLTLMLHPRFWLFIPPFLMHIPAYIVGPLVARRLMKPGEQETIAELTVVPSGIAYGLTSYIVSAKFASMLFSGQIATMWPGMPHMLIKAGQWFVETIPSMHGLRRVLGTVTIMYWTTWVVFKWHSLLVKGNHTQLQRVLVSWKVLLGVLSSPARDIPSDELELYTRPPLPAVNKYIKRRNPIADFESGARVGAKIKSPGSSRLIRHLFTARRAAESVVRALRQ